MIHNEGDSKKLQPLTVSAHACLVVIDALADVFGCLSEACARRKHEQGYSGSVSEVSARDRTTSLAVVVFGSGRTAAGRV
jgi:hypothetical protein